MREELRERWQEREYVAPLVGRERELAQLLDAWTRAQRGEGQLIMLVGEPGVGKSRLAAEVVDMVSSSSTTRVVRARSLSYGQQVSLWLLADLLRSLFGVHETDGQDEVQARFKMAIPTILREAEAEAQGEALDVLGEVLGLPAGGSLVGQAGPEIRRHALIRSLRTLLGAMAERGPLVLLLEDLHWIDSASQDVLRELLVDVPGIRILVLVTARQRWTAPWSDWGWPERLTLRPLEEADAATLAGAVLGGMQLAPEVLHYVAERAAGNPFFLEELLHALDESGGLVQQGGAMYLVPGAADRLPSALTEVVLARLDRLEAQVKQVAQVGSVIGRSFAVRLLARVMKREQAALELPLTALQEAEIAFPRRSPDLEYTFKHVTMREVAYNTLVARRRKELHLQTARAIAALYPSEEYVELIAYHYARTDEPEAVEWLERAGDRAASIYANGAALTYYQEAMKRLPGDARDIARLQEKMGEVLHHAGRDEEAIPVLQQAADGYRAALDLEGAGRAIALLGRVHRFWGTPEQGIALVEPMVEELRQTGPTPALASLHVALAHLYFLVGRYREMLTAAEHGAEIARAVRERRVLGEAEMRRGTALQMLGQVDDGRQVLELALPLVEAGGDLNCLFITLNNLGSACYRLGQLHQERRYMEQALAVTERMGNPHRVCFALGGLGSTLVLLGEWQDARDLLQRGVELGKTLARTPDISNPITYLGLLALWEGNWDEASQLLDMALSIAGETENRQESEGVQGYLAELDVLQGRPEKAIARLEPLVEEEDAALGFLLPPLALAYLALDGEQYLQHAERTTERALSELRGQPGVLIRILSVKGMLLIRRGQPDDAEQVLIEGLELARSMPNPYEEGRTLTYLGTAHEERGEHERARECLQEALAIFRRLGAGKHIKRMEEALAGLAGA